jgi:hypothetical protein
MNSFSILNCNLLKFTSELSPYFSWTSFHIGIILNLTQETTLCILKTLNTCWVKAAANFGTIQATEFGIGCDQIRMKMPLIFIIT